MIKYRSRTQTPDSRQIQNSRNQKIKHAENMCGLTRNCDVWRVSTAYYKNITKFNCDQEYKLIIEWDFDGPKFLCYFLTRRLRIYGALLFEWRTQFITVCKNWEIFQDYYIINDVESITCRYSTYISPSSPTIWSPPVDKITSVSESLRFTFLGGFTRSVKVFGLFFRTVFGSYDYVFGHDDARRN